MRYKYLLLSRCFYSMNSLNNNLKPNSVKIIKNAENPSCCNCIHFIPYDNDYSLSKCKKFGDKNIITDEITNYYASNCRTNEEKCGLSGKYFELNSKINIQINNFKKFWYRNSFLIYYYYIIIVLVYCLMLVILLIYL